MASLAERMKKVALRDIDETDDEVIEAAKASKAGLAGRMQNLLEGGQDTSEEPYQPAPFEVEFAEEVEAISSFARRMEGLIEEEETARKVDTGKERGKLFQWFLGQVEQDDGEGAITEIPEVAIGWDELDFYAVEPPFSFVRIEQNPRTGENIYRVIEPNLSTDETEIFEFVEEALIRGLDTSPGDLDAASRAQFVTTAVRQILKDYRIRIDRVSQARIEYFIRRDFLGLGPIHALMNDPEIEDISCDGPRSEVFIFHRVYETIATNIRFRDDADLDGYVIRVAQRGGKAISISEPMLDAALPDGSRLQATLGHEVTENGSTFTIRRFKPDPFTAADLIRLGTMSPEMLAWLWLIVENGQSLIFSGGTASGKTTSLNAISQFIPPNTKLVSIEDTREVNLPHKNWIRAVTRAGSRTDAAAEIGMFELLKAALRQRPEYILVGEVRGIEATVAFQAMATGHAVYSTMHADSARSVVYRLENEPINIPRLVLQALDVIAIQAQVRVKGKRVRRVTEIVELVGIEPSSKELLTNRVFRWDPDTDTIEYTGRSYMLEAIAKERSWTTARQQQEWERRQQALEWMVERGLRRVEEVTAFVKAYLRDPVAAMKRLEPKHG